jgi:pyruvate,water dikinase
VPTGFHITTAAYTRYVEANGAQAAIAGNAHHATADDPASLADASAAIGALFAWGTLPDEVAAAIGAAYAHLGDGSVAVAVRSSATAEDLPDLSFAGAGRAPTSATGRPTS